MSEPVTAETFRAAFERIAASRDREEAEEAYGEFEEILEAVIGRLAAYQETTEMLRRLAAATDPYGLDADNTPFDAHTEFAASIFAAKELLARIDALPGETGPS